MRIQHNISAMNSYRQLGNNNNMLSKNLEKLSSGYRINRAGDDAAGLAISEKMRAQIKGLETASKNANDAISLVQTAEGALTEVHSMLNRMTELATQSANGTYDNKVDRENLQKEVVARLDEIDRISESTNFNGINLLDGTLGMSGVSFGAGADVGVQTTTLTAAGTVSGTKEGALTAGTPAQTASSSFYMSDDILANGGTGQDTTIKFDVDDGAGGTTSVTITLAGANDGGGDPQDVTETMENIVKELNSGTGGDSTATVAVQNGAIANVGDLAAAYNFEFVDNKLTITAKTAGADYGISNFAVGTGNVADKTAMEQKLYDQGAGGNYALGSVAGEPHEGADEVVGQYKLAETTLTLSGADPDKSAVTVDGKTYFMVNKDTVLTEAEEKMITDNGFTKVTFDDAATLADGSNATAAEALAEAINAAGGPNAGKFAANATSATAIELKETAAQGNAVYAAGNTDGSVKMADLVSTTVKTETAADKGNHQITLDDTMEAGTQITVGDKTYEFVADGATKLNDKAIAVAFTEGDGDANAAALQAEIAKDANFANATVSDGTIDLGVDRDTDVKLAGAGKGRAMQVGDTADDFNKVFVKVNAMDSKSLGIDEINISTQEGASVAIEKIKAAINTVSSTRGDLGAVQNRLEHTINNLGVTTENITAAESRIRDTDMASEMMAYTKNNILIQASQAMLAQANQVPQGVLQLLQ